MRTALCLLLLAVLLAAAAPPVADEASILVRYQVTGTACAAHVVLRDWQSRMHFAPVRPLPYVTSFRVWLHGRRVSLQLDAIPLCPGTVVAAIFIDEQLQVFAIADEPSTLASAYLRFPPAE